MYVAGTSVILVVESEGLVDLRMYFVLGPDLEDERFALYRFNRHSSHDKEAQANQWLKDERLLRDADKGFSEYVQVAGRSLHEEDVNARYRYDKLIGRNKNETVYRAGIGVSRVSSVAFYVELKFERDGNSEQLSIPFEGGPTRFLYEPNLRVSRYHQGEINLVAENDEARKVIGGLVRNYE